MFTNSHFSSQIASDRQRDLLADAERYRLAAQFRGLPREPRRVIRAGQGLFGALRRLIPDRTVAPA